MQLFKLIESKNDGWSYSEELVPPGTFGIRYEDVWNDILLSFLNDYECYKVLGTRDRVQIRKAIEKKMLEKIESFKQELFDDLVHSIHIYPLIKKGGE